MTRTATRLRPAATAMRAPWPRAASGGHGGHGGGHLHDAPPAMATALIALAIGSIVAG